MSHPSKITIDQSAMAPGYRATWVDPASGATRTATPGSTFDSSSQGSNSVGDSDWALVLSTDTPPTAVTRAGKARLVARSWVRGKATARLRARLTITYACSKCDPERPIVIEGRLRNGSWRTIRKLTYRHSEHLKLSVPYKLHKVRVKAPALHIDTHTAYAKVVSNTIRVPRKP
jgi:hypothetical protein